MLTSASSFMICWLGENQKGHDAGVTCVDFDDKCIISGSMDRTIRKWDPDNYTDDIFVLSGHDAAVTCLQFWRYA